MATACIAHANLADAGVVSASSSIVLAPPSRLQNPHVARHWRALGTNEAVLANLGAAQTIDTVAIMGINLTGAGFTRIRASLDDVSGLDGTAYDSDPGGAIPGRVDPRYATLIHLLPAPVSARYVRIDLVDPSLAAIEAGRLFVGLRHTFASNFSFGWSRGWTDRSRKTESRGGQTYVDPDTAYRSVEVQFEALREGERYGVVEEIDRLNGEHADVLFVTDPDSPNLGRDSIWGLLDGQSPVQQPAAWIDDTPIYTRSYRIKERL